MREIFDLDLVNIDLGLKEPNPPIDQNGTEQDCVVVAVTATAIPHTLLAPTTKGRGDIPRPGRELDGVDQAVTPMVIDGATTALECRAKTTADTKSMESSREVEMQLESVKVPSRKESEKDNDSSITGIGTGGQEKYWGVDMVSDGSSGEEIRAYAKTKKIS